MKKVLTLNVQNILSVSNNLILKGINYAYLNVKRNVYSVKCHTGEEKGMGGGNFNK